MGVFTPDANNLRDLYVSTLEQALNSERQIAEKGLPAMIEKSTNPKLAQALRNHLTETKEHVTRLERILKTDKANKGTTTDTKCKVTAALISDAEADIKDAANESIRDVILMASGAKVEHHEIAVYSALCTWAEALGETKDVKLLEKTLQEEENADTTLTELAQRINVGVAVA